MAEIKGNGLYGRSERAAVWLLAVVGLAFAAVHAWNAIPAYDDLYLPDRFSGFVAQYGHLRTAWILFTGMDLNWEYRTYGLARLLQFAMWRAVGAESPAYSLFIGLTQLGTGILLLRLALRHGLDMALACALAIVWVASPHAINWSFHHYAYLILPSQLLVLACYLMPTVGMSRWRWVFAAVAGAALGLTGEIHLVAAGCALLLLGATRRPLL